MANLSDLIIDKKANQINGVDSPGNDKYYGTNSSGTAGFFNLPEGGSGSGGSSSGGGTTQVLIESVELTSPATSIGFSSIPQQYSHLVLKCILGTDSNTTQDDVKFTINGDTADSNYHRQRFLASGTLEQSGEAADRTAFFGIAGATSLVPYCSCDAEILFYSDASTGNFVTSKVLTRVNTSVLDLVIAGMSKAANEAVTDILLEPNLGTNFISGSKVELWGISSTSNTSEGGSSGERIIDSRNLTSGTSFSLGTGLGGKHYQLRYNGVFSGDGQSWDLYINGLNTREDYDGKLIFSSGSGVGANSTDQQAALFFTGDTGEPISGFVDIYVVGNTVYYRNSSLRGSTALRTLFESITVYEGSTSITSINSIDLIGQGPQTFSNFDIEVIGF